MNLFSWFRKATPTPSELVSAGIIIEKPLYQQFQRIGGGIDPTGVSNIMRQADSGQPARLVDLANESRQKDGHLLGVLGTRDRAVALLDFEFVAPEDATEKENAALKLCERVRDDFKNWPVLVSHLAGSYFHGHATAEIEPWVKTSDGFLLPNKAKPIHARDFIFSAATGELRYARNTGDTVGIDLLAENPGRIVEIQRRIVGDVPAREGLARVLVWAALFRNWSLRDWIALGEIGWKPWRIGKHKQGANQKDVDALVDMLGKIGSQGVGVIPDTTELNVEWPKGAGAAGNSSTHRELFDAMGREISKAVLGNTTSTEAGPNGDRASTQTRDEIRKDIREEEARAVASALMEHLFSIVVAVNLGPDVRVPAGYFNTDEGEDQKKFSEVIKNLRDAGTRIPAAWVREQVGMPEPLESDELLGQESAGQPEDDTEPAQPTEPVKSKAAPDDASNGREYTDRVEESAASEGAKHIAPTVASLIAAVYESGSYAEARAAILARYKTMPPPKELAQVADAAITLAQASGLYSIIEETPEVSGGKT